MSEETTKKPRLAAAAEALIKAASLEVDSFTQKKLEQNLDDLKASFDSNLNKVVQKMISFNENFDAKINTLNQHVTSVKSEIGALKSLMEEEFKAKTLERARDLVHLGSFNYFTKDFNQYSTQKNSSEIKTAIAWFSLGYGYTIPDATLERVYASDQKIVDQGKKAFREKFTKQIKDLIEREPRLVQEADGRFVIYYS
jgi:hypothetical protein